MDKWHRSIPTASQALGVGQVGRIDQYHSLAGGGEACQGWPQQSQFSDAGSGDEEFAQRRLRPAAARQNGIQFGMPGRLGGR